jgi:hypothetical protein
MPWRHMEEWMYSSNILDLVNRCSEWSASRPYRSTPGERASGTHWIGGWVSPRAVLDAVEKRKIVHFRESNSGSPARSRWLYRLSYFDSGAEKYHQQSVGAIVEHDTPWMRINYSTLTVGVCHLTFMKQTCCICLGSIPYARGLTHLHNMLFRMSLVLWIAVVWCDTAWCCRHTRRWLTCLPGYMSKIVY